MNVTKIGFRQLEVFSPLFLDYIEGKETLQGFYGLHPNLENIKQQIAARSFTPEKRKLLAEELLAQYKGIEVPEIVKENIERLRKENTFTITTGHQLNLATGPLYFVYKILTVIKACEELTLKFPDANFVPVFWMATEDHDFEEINHFHLFGKKYVWETGLKGAVGRFPVEGIEKVLAQLPEKFEILTKAYSKGKNLADATRILINDFFGKYGLVILDGDSKPLKASFKAIVQEELHNSSVGNTVEATTQKLQAQGFKTQVFPRDINLFLLLEKDRQRITRTNTGFTVLPDTLYSKTEIDQLVEDAPERFSPNVALRPLYQEFILPNLAYIGGPSEVIYWLQLKEAFELFKIPFPMLLPRNFFLLIDKNSKNKLGKVSIRTEDLFLSTPDLKEKYLREVAGDTIDLSLELGAIENTFGKIAAKAVAIDKSLEGFVLAERQKVFKELDTIAKRLKKAEEAKFAVGIAQIEKIKEKLFPGGGLQERSANIFSFLANDPSIIDKLKAVTEPFDFSFKVVEIDG